MFTKRNFSITFATAAVFLFSLILTGCGSSEEAEKERNETPNAAAMMTKQLDDLKAENAALKQQVEKLQENNRTLTAHTAELETQIEALREKPEPAPITETAPPTRKHAAGNEQEIYDEALAQHHHKQYDQALTGFESVVDAGGSLSDRAQYWAGECQYGLKDFHAAVESFKKVLEYPRSTKKDDAQMMIANCYLALGQKSKAKTEYEKLVTKYPASLYVKRAKAKMEQL